MSTHFERVEFKTLDGLTLQGRFYPASRRGPAVVITPGFNCVKEMFVPEVAEQFQLADISALIYDPRNLGESEGLPRNDIDPMKQVSDYSDACSFLCTLPLVDPKAISFWGISFAGTIAMCAASLDKRARCCIAVCPALNYELTPQKFPKVLAKSMRDRESQLAGNEPAYLPVLDDAGVNPAGMAVGTEKEDFDYMINAKRMGAPNHENRTTLQSYYKLIMWQPQGIVKYMHSTPVLMILGEYDRISPIEEQFALFESFRGQKQLHVSPGKGHLNVLSGDDFPAMSKMQSEYIKKIVTQ